MASRVVALRKESVDRNDERVSQSAAIGKSLSARRAWIEIIPKSGTFRSTHVALRKESVDRNVSAFDILAISAVSLSARRAWIEIVFLTLTVRNVPSRSPQGERG